MSILTVASEIPKAFLRLKESLVDAKIECSTEVSTFQDFPTTQYDASIVTIIQVAEQIEETMIYAFSREDQEDVFPDTVSFPIYRQIEAFSDEVLRTAQLMHIEKHLEDIEEIAVEIFKLHPTLHELYDPESKGHDQICVTLILPSDYDFDTLVDKEILFWKTVRKRIPKDAATRFVLSFEEE